MKILAICLLFACAALPGWTQVMISEFMADNTRTIADGDGEWNDWIEIHNPGAEAVDLEGWALTDDALDPAKWTFPAVSLPAKGYLLVWASNKDRRIPGEALHTNFKLERSGEFLALVKPDGTRTTTFAPAFPEQVQDLSYGYATELSVTTPVKAGSAGKYLVPASGAPGTTWTAPEFDDSAWSAATNGLGYETGVSETGAGWQANVLAHGPAAYYRMEEAGSPLAVVNLGNAGTAVNATSTGTVTPGISGPRPPAFAGMPSTNRAVRMAGSSNLEVPWHPDLNPDVFSVECWARATGGAGTFRAVISSRNDQNATVSGYTIYAGDDNQWQFWTGSGTTGAWDPVIGPAVVLNEWVHLMGTFDGTVKRFFVNGVLSGTGTSSVFNPNKIQGMRIGAGANESPVPGFRFTGEIDEVAVFPKAFSETEVAARFALAKSNTIPPASFFTGLIQTNLQAGMLGVNASAYLRLPFNISDTRAVDQLVLKMKYDDGFQAWLNGVPVASGNRPDTLTWNSAASERSSNAEAVQFESFSLGSALASLRNGPNILAIHGLNLDAANPDFLQLAQLELKDVISSSLAPVFLNVATPGAPNSTGSTTPGPAITEHRHAPALPTITDDLVITCRVSQVFTPVASVTLRWRKAYTAEQSMAMSDDGMAGDLIAGDGIYTAVISKTNHSQGQIMRWSFLAADTAGNTSRWPLYNIPDNSPQYSGTMIAATGFTTALPVWYWFAQSTGTASSRTGTRGAVFYNGTLYDNVFIRLRGGATSSGSKKFDFNTGHHCLINDIVGKVEEANLNGSSQDPTLCRPPLAFEVYRAAEHPACHAFPLMMRVNGTADSGSGNGGIAYFVEQVDERMLSRSKLDPDGALYKMDQRSSLEPCFWDTTNGVEKKTRLTENRADLQAVVSKLRASNDTGNPATAPNETSAFLADREIFLFDNVNVANVINYLAARAIVNEYDDVRKNFYFYRDTEGSREWHVLPWDKDGTFGITGDAGSWLPHPFWGDYPHRKSNADQWCYLWQAMFRNPKTKAMYLRRLRTVMDSILKTQPPAGTSPPGSMEARADKCFAPVAPHKSGTTMAPVKSFLTSRRNQLFTTYLDATTNANAANRLIPTAQSPTITVNLGMVDFLPASGNQAEEFVEILNPHTVAVDISGWRLSGGIDHTFEAGTVILPGDRMYLANNSVAFRARAAAPRGGQSLYVQGNYDGSISARGETLVLTDPMDPAIPSDDRMVATLNTPAAPTPMQQWLRITEIMYDPPAGGSFPSGEYEYLELMNTGADPLTVSGASFTEGVTFSFNTLVIAPFQRVLVVKNQAAFEARYNNNLATVGVYTGSLDNSGERIRLVDAFGEEVLDFRYEGIWYPGSHGRTVPGGGSSLVIRDPGATWNTWGEQASWSASQLRGSPGTSDPALLPATVEATTAISFSLTGQPGRSYRMQQSFDLSTWTNLEWQTAGADSRFSAPVPMPRRVRAYYRWVTH